MIRTYWLKLWVTAPIEAFYGTRGRLACRLFHYHGITCRGRKDHRPIGSVRGRWAKPYSRWRI